MLTDLKPALFCREESKRPFIHTHTHSVPSVVLGIEQEVCTHDGNTDGHDDQDDEDEEHKAVHIVDLVRPERREDKIPVKASQNRITTLLPDTALHIHTQTHVYPNIKLSRKEDIYTY